MRPAIDHQGRLWFGEMGRNYLVIGIVAGISNNTFWFTEAGTDSIGMLQVPAS